MNFLRSFSPRSDTPQAPRQAGAMPYAVVEGEVVFLLVTARRSGKWIFPKGGVAGGSAPWESAAQEAMEEAGVSGEVSPVPIGSYRTRVSDTRGSLAEVDLFPLLVKQQHDKWPEMKQRLRHWATLGEAKRLLAQRQLGVLAEALSQQIRQQRADPGGPSPPDR